MKTSCSSWSYHRTFAKKRMDQFTWLDECAALGLDGVELLSVHFAATDPAYLRRLKKACADRHLTIAMVSAEGHLTTSDDAKREADIAGIARWVDIAAWLGAPLVRFFCGAGDELAAGGPALHAKVIAAMKKVAALGEAKGIVMALENHGGVSADQLLKLYEDVGSPWIAFTLDTGNFPPGSRVGPETYNSIRRCAPHAAIIHAKFFNVREDGQDRDFEWPRIHAALKEAGFRGFLSVEYEGADADEVAVMRRIATYLKTLR